MKTKKQTIANWSNYPVASANIFNPENGIECQNIIDNHPPSIPRGLGRSYGDASLGDNVIATNRLNCFLHFDKDNGILKAESGVSLSEILDVCVPAGWFLPVTPGTKYVTLGGAVAADVHGKNHHKEGSFRDFVQEIEILTACQELITCSSQQNPSVFEATCGGMGLTGIILNVTIKLKKIETSRIVQYNYKARNLDEAFRLFEQNIDATYSVAWSDCLAKGKNLGKSILMTGEHAKVDDLPAKEQQNPLKVFKPSRKNMPFFWPSRMLNAWSVAAFNKLYYWKNKGAGKNIVPYEPYFYPLDAIKNWNRMYGKNGFVQYQFVLPTEESYEGIKKVLEKVSRDGTASFLVVLKKMGKGHGWLSFPLEGYTLALDFPVSQRTFRLLEKLDEIVEQHKGRIYLAKDARMKPDFFQKSYSELEKFQNFKNENDPDGKFASHLAQRLKIQNNLL